MLEITHHHKIKINSQEVGYIQLVKYHSSTRPQIEFLIDDEYQRKGIMTRELKSFLVANKKLFPILALVEPANLASQKLLQKSNFVKILDNFQGYKVFLINACN